MGFLSSCVYFSLQDGLLPPKVAKGKARQKALVEKREAQCRIIKSKVMHPPPTQTEQKPPTANADNKASLEEGFLKELMTPDDAATHFAMSLVDHLRKLPDTTVLEVQINIYKILQDAQKRNTEPQKVESVKEDSVPLPELTPEMQVCSGISEHFGMVLHTS